MKLERSASLLDRSNPLVSVRIFNYNYGTYLEKCINSVLTQTYPNIEICFSDNCSTDNSWEIALDFQKNYPDVFNIACNRQNFGPGVNLRNCIYPSRGKYIVNLCSDDAMAPEFVESCVRVLENNPACGYVMVNRAIMDEHDNITEEPAFYNQSCIVQGEEQAAVYMMAAVNPSVSQVMYAWSKAAIVGQGAASGLAGRWYGTRLMDFMLCCKHPMAYLKAPLLLHRIHGKNDSLNAADNLIEIIGPFLLNYQYAEIAQARNLTKVSERLPAATEKLSSLCLRYCARFLIAGNEEIAQKYFSLSSALSLSVKSDKTYREIAEFWSGSKEQKLSIVKGLKREMNLVTRKISYDPPDGSTILKDV